MQQVNGSGRAARAIELQSARATLDCRLQSCGPHQDSLDIKPQAISRKQKLQASRKQDAGASCKPAASKSKASQILEAHNQTRPARLAVADRATAEPTTRGFRLIR